MLDLHVQRAAAGYNIGSYQVDWIRFSSMWLHHNITVKVRQFNCLQTTGNYQKWQHWNNKAQQSSSLINTDKQVPLSSQERRMRADHFRLVRCWRRLWPVGVHSAALALSAGREPPYWPTPGSATLPCFPHLQRPSCGSSMPVRRPGEKHKQRNKLRWTRIVEYQRYFMLWI